MEFQQGSNATSTPFNVPATPILPKFLSNTQTIASSRRISACERPSYTASVDSFPSLSIYAHLPGTQPSDLGAWLQAECNGKSTIIRLPEGRSKISLPRGLTINRPVSILGTPGCALSVPFGQSITISVKRNPTEDMVVFRECEFQTAPSPISGISSLFIVEGRSSYLQLCDCALSCAETKSERVIGIEVQAQPPEVGEHTSAVVLRSCSFSYFWQGVVARENVILKIERSHIIHSRGAGIIVSDPVWCKIMTTVIDRCAVCGISIILSQEQQSAERALERHIVIEGNLITNSITSGVQITGRSQNNFTRSMDSEQQLFTKVNGTDTLFGSLLHIDANSPFAPVDVSYSDSVFISLTKNKIWLNGRDGITIRHVVSETLKIDQNDVLDNRNSAVFLQRVIIRSEGGANFSQSRFNRSQEDFGVYLNQVQGNIQIQDCEIKHNQASGIMLLGDMEKQTNNNTSIHCQLILQNCKVIKNRDHGLNVVDYRGQVAIRRCLFQNNFQNGISVTFRLERFHSTINQALFHQMVLQNLITKVLVGKKTQIIDNWKHAIYCHFVRLHIDKEAKLQAMGAKEPTELGAGHVNYAVMLNDQKSAWLIQIEEDAEVEPPVEALLSSGVYSVHESETSYRGYVLPLKYSRIKGKIGGPKWGQYSMREQAMWGKIVGHEPARSDSTERMATGMGKASKIGISCEVTPRRIENRDEKERLGQMRSPKQRCACGPKQRKVGDVNQVRARQPGKSCLIF